MQSYLLPEGWFTITQTTLAVVVRLFVRCGFDHRSFEGVCPVFFLKYGNVRGVHVWAPADEVKK